MLDSGKYHVYLLEPLEDNQQLTEVLVWTDEPKRLKVQLFDLVDDNYGAKLASHTAEAPLSRLRIQKPTLLYLSKSGGELDYRLIWRKTQMLEPGQEHEPNTPRLIDPALFAILPHMHQLSDTEYRLNGFHGIQDKTDYCVLETDDAGFVTLEASAGAIGMYIGSKHYQSKVIDKRTFLADILVLPGKNVFYRYGAKRDYTVKATLSPLSDRWHELEPNDSRHLAHRLPIGRKRTGRLPLAKDYDYYYFDWPTTGKVRFDAQSGAGGDLSLWLYRDGVELKEFKAAESISESVELDAGLYGLLAYTRKPSLGPYTISARAENPFLS